MTHNEDKSRTRDHVRQFLETAQKHGADGKDAVIGAIAGIREFVEDQTGNDQSELDFLARLLTGDKPEGTKDTMGPQLSVFNNHVNDAGDRARELMATHMPLHLKRLEDIETEHNGIMGIFNYTEPEPAALVYIGIVFGLVNQGRQVSKTQE